MTAFARTATDIDQRHLVWELKSVNHRYLETSYRLPDTLRNIEQTTRELSRKHLSRGKLDCTLRIERIAGSTDLSVNTQLIGDVLKAIEQVRTNSGQANVAMNDSINPMDVLRWPGVLDDRAADPQRLEKAAVTLFEQALTQLIEVRAQEGGHLRTLIEDRLSQMQALVEALGPLTQSLAQHQKQRIQARLADLETNVDANRLEQEVALLAQKADVAEELDRLQIHIKQARTHIKGKGPHGRRLDFLTQELNREANTLGAKSILAETSEKAVDLKVLIEQIREQAQNIE